MKFTVYYIDDQKTTASIRASRPELAARQFLALHPRSDTSQITVESMPSAPHVASYITHFRACDLIGTPPAAEVIGDEDLALRIINSSYPDFIQTFVVAGSENTLRFLATDLLDAIAASDSDPFGGLYSVPVTPTDGSRLPHRLRFDLEPEPSRLWTGSSTSRSLWRERVRLVARLLIGALTCIGIWTVSRWIF